jgi:hypothetical protein
VKAPVIDSLEAGLRFADFAEPAVAGGETLVEVTAAGVHPIVRMLASEGTDQPVTSAVSSPRRRGPPSLSYGLIMPAVGTPAPEDAVTARRILLTGLAQEAALPDLLGELEPLHPRGNTFPGEVFLRLAADALAWSSVSPADPLPLEGIRERFTRVLRAGPGPAQAPVRGAGGRGPARRSRTGPAR